MDGGLGMTWEYLSPHMVIFHGPTKTMVDLTSHTGDTLGKQPKWRGPFEQPNYSTCFLAQ